MRKTIQLIPVYNDWEYPKLHIPEPASLVRNNLLQYELPTVYDRSSIKDSFPFLNNALSDIRQKVMNDVK